MAHLLGECKKSGIEARLVQGSPETLKCLIDDSVFWLFSQGYRDVVNEIGESAFRSFLKSSYRMATSSNICDKTNPEALDELWQLTHFMREMVWPSWLPEHLFGEIKKAKPDVVGFSVWNFYDKPAVTTAIKKVMQRVKRELGLKVIIGGPGTLTRTARRDIMEIFSPDFIAHHEGEHALIDILNMIESGRYKELPNVSTKAYDGETKPIENIDLLATPDFSQYDLDSFFLPMRVLPLMTSRGCPWGRCAFCSHHAIYSGYREHSAERVAEIIEHYKKRYKTEMIMLHDETLTAERVRGLIDTLPEAYYYSYAYPRGFHIDILKKMYEKGFRVLVWGVESGCQPVLNNMQKGTTVAEIEQILHDSQSVGITNVAFIMFGFPGETREQALETVAFLEKNAPYIERHAATPFRLEEGSPIWENPKHWGVKALGGGAYKVKRGMQSGEVREFLRELGTSPLSKTSSDTKYYMPGDSEFRAYLFMQAVYGEGVGDYPVKNGILVENEIWPSLLMRNVLRPKVKLSKKQRELYLKCDGRHKVDAEEFKKYPYVVFYQKRL